MTRRTAALDSSSHHDSRLVEKNVEVTTASDLVENRQVLDTHVIPIDDHPFDRIG